MNFFRVNESRRVEQSCGVCVPVVDVVAGVFVWESAGSKVTVWALAVGGGISHWRVMLTVHAEVAVN